MNQKLIELSRKAARSLANFRFYQPAIDRVNGICPPDGGPAKGAKKKLPRYIINSVEMSVTLPGHETNADQMARVTYVIDTLTLMNVATTVHFEPADLRQVGISAGYDAVAHAAAEIRHFRSLFPGQTN